jgi:phosphatidylserine decarboxylase
MSTEPAQESPPAVDATFSHPGRERATIEPRDPGIASIQPGGGLCMRIELLWGRWRRWWLRTFRPGYVARMRALRRGDVNCCPHEVLDPRDVKFFRNQGGHSWAEEDDPFGWRDRLPFARVGLAELTILGGGFFALAVLAGFVFWPVAVIPGLLGLGVLWFYRDPRRTPPEGAGLVLAPADGKVVAIEEIDRDDFIGGRALLIGIFLSVFNVHINRSPMSVRVIGLSYRRGKFLNAMKPASARENEQLAIRLEEHAPPHRRMIVRQIAGAVARRIVCWARPGEQFEIGSQFGMIKLGSRTELVLAHEPGLEVKVRVGQKVKAGVSVLAQFHVESQD